MILRPFIAESLGDLDFDSDVWPQQLPLLERQPQKLRVAP